jgi:hypothetical protein
MPANKFVNTLVTRAVFYNSGETDYLVAQPGCAQMDFCLDPLQFPDSTTIKSLNVSVRENIKSHALKLKLFDENGCSIGSLCVPPCQWQWVELNPILSFTGCGPQEEDYTSPDPVGFPTFKVQVLQLNVLNLQLWADYVQLEGNGFYNQQSNVNIHNLLCDAEKNTNLIQDIVDNIDDVLAATYSSDAKRLTVNIIQDFLKMRAVALTELCNCGKSCVSTPIKVGSNFCVDRSLGCNRPGLTQLNQ